MASIAGSRGADPERGADRDPDGPTACAGQPVILSGSRACSRQSPQAVSNACPPSADKRRASRLCATAFRWSTATGPHSKNCSP